jgi:hypothetical protein
MKVFEEVFSSKHLVQLLHFVLYDHKKPLWHYPQESEISTTTSQPAAAAQQ